MSIRLSVGLDILDLPNPILGDGDELDTKTRNLFSMRGEVYTYKYTAVGRRLTLVFDRLSAENVEDLITFIEAHANVTVTFRDWKSRTFSVRIITTPSEYAAIRDGEDCEIFEGKLDLIVV
jgi:hypothetical protein